MSLTSKQIDELRAYAKDRKGELAKLINDAADTIEMLSAKLHASQMERSSQYYHGGWIPCSERLPGEDESFYVLCCDMHGEVMIGHAFACDDGETPYSAESENEYMYDCIAWMPLPEPARLGD